jgi:mevalonate kinase
VAAVAAAQRPDLDQKMGDATTSAIEGLRTYALGRKRVGLDAVAQAMTQGMVCFEEWGLVPDPIRAQADRLLQEGALAVKLTGAGGGGYLVALWND